VLQATTLPVAYELNRVVVTIFVNATVDSMRKSTDFPTWLESKETQEKLKGKTGDSCYILTAMQHLYCIVVLVDKKGYAEICMPYIPLCTHYFRMCTRYVRASSLCMNSCVLLSSLVVCAVSQYVCINRAVVLHRIEIAVRTLLMRSSGCTAFTAYHNTHTCALQ
jgi:hypothetical protein